MKWIYALLCVLGFALPYYFFVPFVFAMAPARAGFIAHVPRLSGNPAQKK